MQAGVSLGCPPPDVQDHDAPGFSDPGAPDEAEDFRLNLSREAVAKIRAMRYKMLDGKVVRPFYGLDRDAIEHVLWDALCAIAPALDDMKDLSARAIEQAVQDVQKAECDGE
jgi:hypothetical protein